MPQVQYDLNRFAPREKQPEPQQPRLRVASKTKSQKKAQRAETLRMVRLLLMAAFVVVLVSGVLGTQARIAELQSGIASMETELAEEQSMNVYLTFQLEELVNLRNIDEKAAALGLVQMDSSKVNYVRVEAGDNIKVKENTLDSLLASLTTGFLDTMESIFS